MKIVGEDFNPIVRGEHFGDVDLFTNDVKVRKFMYHSHDGVVGFVYVGDCNTIKAVHKSIKRAFKKSKSVFKPQFKGDSVSYNNGYAIIATVGFYGNWKWEHDEELQIWRASDFLNAFMYDELEEDR